MLQSEKNKQAIDFNYVYSSQIPNAEKEICPYTLPFSLLFPMRGSLHKIPTSTIPAFMSGSEKQKTEQFFYSCTKLDDILCLH